jgi:hypothetical protein
MSVAKHLPGTSLFIEMSVETPPQGEVTEITDVSQKYYHIIRVTNGSTITQDVELTSKLPNGVRQIAFKSVQRDRWSSLLSSVRHTATGVCELDVLSRGAGDERIQCTDLKSTDTYTPTNWRSCAQGLPLELTIKVS